jgi:hypothetical protein
MPGGETVQAMEDDMTWRHTLLHTRRTVVLSGSLLLGSLAVPAGAETTGERALLNKSQTAVITRSVSAAPNRGVIDGVRALLNRPAADETVIAFQPSIVPGTAAADAPRVSGERALLGRIELSSSAAVRARRQ